MSECSFTRLLEFVNQQLDLDGRLEVYNHLDRCDICRDAVCQLSRDLDGARGYPQHRQSECRFVLPALLESEPDGTPL